MFIKGNNVTFSAVFSQIFILRNSPKFNQKHQFLISFTFFNSFALSPISGKACEKHVTGAQGEGKGSFIHPPTFIHHIN